MSLKDFNKRPELLILVRYIKDKKIVFIYGEALHQTANIWGIKTCETSLNSLLEVSNCGLPLGPLQKQSKLGKALNFSKL